MSTRLTKFVDSRDKLLQNLQGVLEKLSRKCETPTSLVNYDHRIGQLGLDQAAIKKVLESYSSKELKCDNSQIDNLKV